MEDPFREFIVQKAAQLRLVFSALDEILHIDMRNVGEYTPQQQKICFGIIEASGALKVSMSGLKELVAMAVESCRPLPPETKPAEAGEAESEAEGEQVVE